MLRWGGRFLLPNVTRARKSFSFWSRHEVAVCWYAQAVEISSEKTFFYHQKKFCLAAEARATRPDTKSQNKPSKKSKTCEKAENNSLALLSNSFACDVLRFANECKNISCMHLPMRSFPFIVSLAPTRMPSIKISFCAARHAFTKHTETASEKVFHCADESEMSLWGWYV